jgi:hypothetical protein
MANGDPAQPMLDWVKGAPPGDLAAELMAAFGPDRPPSNFYISTHELIRWLFRDYGFPKRYNELDYAIDEGVQLLEHSELICFRNTDSPTWRATRLGLATLANGKAAVRQRIMHRTGQ